MFTNLAENKHQFNFPWTINLQSGLICLPHMSQLRPGLKRIEWRSAWARLRKVITAAAFLFLLLRWQKVQFERTMKQWKKCHKTEIHLIMVIGFWRRIWNWTSCLMNKRGCEKLWGIRVSCSFFSSLRKTAVSCCFVCLFIYLFDFSLRDTALLQGDDAFPYKHWRWWRVWSKDGKK